MPCSWVDPTVLPCTQQGGAPGLRLAPISHFGTQPYPDLSMLQVPTLSRPAGGINIEARTMPVILQSTIRDVGYYAGCTLAYIRVHKK